MEWKFMTFGLENLFIFGKFSDFYYTSRFSTQNAKICLQKYPPISGKVSVTNCLKSAIEYQGHLTIENKLKVEKKELFRRQAQLSSPKKTHGLGKSISVGRGGQGDHFSQNSRVSCHFVL